MIIVFTVALAIAATIAVIQTVELKNERTAKSEKDGIISALQTHVANLETEVAKLNSRLKVQQTPVVKTAPEAPVAEATMAPAKPKKRYYKAKKKPATV